MDSRSVTVHFATKIWWGRIFVSGSNRSGHFFRCLILIPIYSEIPQFAQQGKKHEAAGCGAAQADQNNAQAVNTWQVFFPGDVITGDQQSCAKKQAKPGLLSPEPRNEQFSAMVFCAEVKFDKVVDQEIAQTAGSQHENVQPSSRFSLRAEKIVFHLLCFPLLLARVVVFLQVVTIHGLLSVFVCFLPSARRRKVRYGQTEWSNYRDSAH